MRNVRVSVVQFEHLAGQKEANFARIEAFAGLAAQQEVRILAFPECCITGYWFLRKLSRDGLRRLAEPIPHVVSLWPWLSWPGLVIVVFGVHQWRAAR